MKKRKLFLTIGAILALTACGNGGSGGGVYVPPVCDPTVTGYDSFVDEIRKDTYTTYLSYVPTTLNYTTTMQSENASHIANFVDGLVEHDRFGNLVPCLATTTGEPNSDFTEWSFKVKDGIKWMTNESKPYKDKNGNDAYVKAEDFRTILKVVLNSANGSESAYLPMLIIKGAEQFNAATASLQANSAVTDKDLRNRNIFNDLRKAGLTTGENACTVNDIDSILNFERVGVVVDEAANKITYKLTQASDYFPTMLTYLPFLPLNYEYYQNLGSGDGGFGSERNLLFCGAYILKERNNLEIKYEKNPEYWDKDSVKTPKIYYKTLSSEIAPSFAREEYERGTIDGFSLTSQDAEGWDRYVKGPDGKGTIKDPHNAETYSQEGQGDKSSFFFYINMGREAKSTSLSSATANEISNANKALKYSYFRNAFYDAFDLRAYNARNGADELEQTQYQINTYIPKYFVTDNEGKDYFEYTLEAYQKKHNCSKEEAERALNPGNVNQLEFEQAVDGMKKALEQLAKDDPTITYPIKIEYSSLYGDSNEKQFDDLFIEFTNRRLNGCIIDEDQMDDRGLHVCSESEKKVVIVPNTSITNSNSYISVSNSKNYTLFVAGWGPDYGDPMTYLHTMVKGGDLADSLGIEKDSRLSEETEEKLATYGNMVDEANKIVSTTSELKRQRYQAFADAELYLLEELGLFKPLYQRGQGYSCSVSKFIPYRSPRSGYGLSNDKLKGIEIIDRALTSCERKTLKEEWDREKAQSQL